MIKIGRNDACPCGSGKKYKKCCLNKIQENVLLNVEDQQDFNELLPKLFEYSKQFDGELQAIYQRYSSTYEKLKTGDSKAFSKLLFHWLLFNKPLTEDDKSILEKFVEEHSDNYSETVSTTLNKWLELTPQILSVLKVEKGGVVLIDWLTESIHYPEHTELTSQLTEDDLLVGYLYPTPTGVALGSDAVLIPDSLRHHVVVEVDRLFEEFHEGVKDPYFFVEHFHAFLSILAHVSIVDLPSVGFEKIPEQAFAVIDELYNNIELEDYSYDLILLAMEKWYHFASEQAPRIQKVGTYAAAIEYWIANHQHQWTKQTFKQLSEKYGVSPSTISARFKELNSVFSDVTERVPHG
ncbi:YecA family protein [Evansella tamaricis]|uniref:SEC-C domain-containing protein n=1 Tax=Evansella tamaricis TaxID=2069301 RepID=A0ABS6JLB0_9BACI|nr:SEC-C metal-binding domain-containing protein [Evansella tamaricis]MBU9713632.1 SEC-C domain-containing protein [Evansella tamaricis]